MKFKALQENLARGLAIVTKAVGTRPTLPVLANICLTAEDGRLRMSATNLEISLIARVGANVIENGAITVPARTFADFINACPPGEVEITLDEKTNSIKIICGSVKANIKGISADDYPLLVEAEKGAGIAIPAQKLKDLLNKVIFSACDEDSRPVLTAVSTRFETGKMTMVSADGYRLGVGFVELGDLYLEKEMVLNIPKRTLQVLLGLIAKEEGAVFVTTEKNNVIFSTDRVNMSSQLIEGQYPAIEAIIPKTFTTSITADVDSLMRAAKRTQIFSRDAAYTMRMKATYSGTDLAPSELELAGQSQETGNNEGKIDVKMTGLDIDMAFNSAYVIDLLSVADSSQVVLELTTPDKPGVFRMVGNDNFLHVIMPMQTNLR